MRTGASIITLIILSALLLASCTSTDISDYEPDSGVEEVRVSGVRHRNPASPKRKQASPVMSDNPQTSVIAAVQTQQEQQNRDDFESFDTNPVKLVSEAPVSTFSADVDTASYSFVRRRLNAGQLPVKAAVRLEEMVNYFDYAYPKPTSADKPFRASVVVHNSPGPQTANLSILAYRATPSSPTNNPIATWYSCWTFPAP